jgi:CRP-like cAMP-binding protein
MNVSGQASVVQTLSPAHSPSQNHLLAALPAAELDVMSADLELVPMLPGDMLGKSGKAMSHAYFPTTAVVSLHYLTITGALAETADVGHEGMVGVTLFLGGDATPSSALVKCGGHGYRLARERLAESFSSSGLLRSLLLRYTQALIAQIGQTAACYRFHTIEQQLSRWLLSTFDRMPTGELVMTQELVAGLLGVRRESISQTATKLSDSGYIRYRRGHISILDRAGLETQACECYAVVKAELQRLLPRTPANSSSGNVKGLYV